MCAKKTAKPMAIGGLNPTPSMKILGLKSRRLRNAHSATTKNRRNVMRHSPMNTLPAPKPGEKALDPRAPVASIFLLNTPASSPAPNNDPRICPQTITRPSTTGHAPAITSPNVTAQFMCPPETCPIEYASAVIAKPKARATPVTHPAEPKSAVLDVDTAAPHPMKTKRVIAINSTKIFERSSSELVKSTDVSGATWKTVTERSIWSDWILLWSTVISLDSAIIFVYSVL
mmetsp:Transcript_1075/g.1362  ORF Transcript_1075/g.1362 Transcript_1075/m.1362 type:complete len:230 (-) Transcript_1075:86-775(-)